MSKDMQEAGPTCVDPATVPAADLIVPTDPDFGFEGFSEEAFAILDRLKVEPHIEQYRKEKEAIHRFLKEPFKRYRDDLVVHWVIPNRFDFETERNIFSRLLKNDFGAGGCHHHYWMSFYRPGFRRLTDAQLSHSLWPEGLRVGFVLNTYAKGLRDHARTVIRKEPETFLQLTNELLQTGRWWLRYRAGSSYERHTASLQRVPGGLSHARNLEVRTLIPRDEVLASGSALSTQALVFIHDVWPIYRFLISGSS